MRLADLFTHHMVLQQGKPAPIWGWAAPGETVTVTIAGQTASATADADGAWRATLSPLSVGGPYELIVTGATETLTLHDVLVGEVWVASGQSNMQYSLGLVLNAEAELATAVYPQIRLFTVPQRVAMEPQQDIPGAAWCPCTPDNAQTFSAVAYFFGRELHRNLGVPIGLIHTSWGGTPAEAWTSRGALCAEPALKPLLDDFEYALTHLEEATAAYQENLAEWQDTHMRRDPGDDGLAQGWADPAADTADWEVMSIPRSWQSAGLVFSGALWFRKEVDIPAAWVGHDLILSLGPCDKSEVSYFNGVQVGALSIEDREDAWCTPRVYTVPAALVRPGRNVIAVRIFSHMYSGGFMGASVQMQLAPTDLPDVSSIPLAGTWQYNVSVNFGTKQPPSPPQPPLGPDSNHAPAGLYNGMIAPLLPAAIAGAIWYQGESNAARAVEYRTLFPAMIRDWRAKWSEDFPFLFVQLANYMAPWDGTGESRWAELREAQAMALQLPHTGMAVAIDIGEAGDIHPKNKQDVGKRLARWALAQTYGQQVEMSGPLYRAMTIEDGHIRLTFDHVAAGLVARGGPLRGFALAGDDRVFYRAEADMDGDSIVLSSPQVPCPVAARYGWADNPEGANLYNEAGLPASPFRTDTWPALDLVEAQA